MPHVATYMKSRYLLPLAIFILFVNACAVNAYAQGGIGNKPRQDIVMLSQVARDSLSDVVFQNIMDLKRFAESGNIDSAAALIAYNGHVAKGQPVPTDRYARAMNAQNPEERAEVQNILARIQKLFQDYPDTHREYYAVFKTKDTPSGQKHLYQIHHVNGKRQRMVSWTFYPVGDKLLLGDFS